MTQQLVLLTFWFIILYHVKALDFLATKHSLRNNGQNARQMKSAKSFKSSKSSKSEHSHHTTNKPSKSSKLESSSDEGLSGSSYDDECNDMPGWLDIYGDDCDWYSQDADDDEC